MRRLFLENAILFRFDDSVAVARNRFEAGSIQSRERAAAVTDQASFLKRAGSFVYALAPHAQHIGQEFLGELKLTCPHPVPGHQKPASQTSIDRMEAVAGSSL